MNVKLFIHVVLMSFWLFAGGNQQMLAQLLPNLGGQRAGISGLQFLKIGVGGRGAALGDVMVPVVNDVSALYWNPAGLIQTKTNAVMVAHSEWLAGLKHDFIGVSYNISSVDAVGFSLISLATDDIKVTTETQPFGTGEYFRYSDVALGFTYAREMTNLFSFGVTVRYVRETLDVLKMETFLFDIGTFYWMGLGSARLGVVVSNFGSDIAPEGEVRLLDGSVVNTFQTFSPPTVFKISFAFEPIQDELNRLTASVQLNHPNDNAEQVRIGLEYMWNGWLFGRLGLKRTIGEPLLGYDRKSADDISLGLGMIIPTEVTEVSFDYAYTNFNVLGAVHRISLALTY